MDIKKCNIQNWNIFWWRCQRLSWLQIRCMIFQEGIHSCAIALWLGIFWWCICKCCTHQSFPQFQSHKSLHLRGRLARLGCLAAEILARQLTVRLVISTQTGLSFHLWFKPRNWGFYDFLHLYQTFYADLPESIQDFKVLWACLTKKSIFSKEKVEL